MERVKIPTAKMRYETITVPGRDGTLKIKQGLEDIEFTISLNVLNTNFIENLRILKNKYLMNIKEISFTDDNLIYYKVKEVEIEDIENKIRTYGKFDLKLICEPFAYLKETADFKEYNYNIGSDKYLREYNINNDGWETGSIFKIKMVDRFSLPDDTEIKINGIEILNFEIPGYSELILDCDKEICYLTSFEGVVISNVLDVNFIKTKPGKNKIEIRTDEHAEILIKKNIRYI